MRGIGLIVLPLAACTPAFDGVWAGACEGAGIALRVQVSPYEPDDGAPRAVVNGADPTRPGGSLYEDCLSDVSGADVVVSDCTGGWDGDTSLPLTLTGTLERGELVPRLVGECAFEGASAPLELWQLP